MNGGSLAAATAAIVDLALAEDEATRDITTQAIVPEDAHGTARLVARESCVVAGLPAFVSVFERLGRVEIAFDAEDGDLVEEGATVASLQGPVRALLAGERTALNLVQHLSGVATLTRRFVDAAPGVEIRDTRKTLPGLRALEKAAVAAGGGTNHRMTLADRFLVKDNHVAIAGGIAEAIRRARASDPSAWLEVECDDLDQVAAAAEAGADEILLDNMSPEGLRRAVELIGGRCRTEASGGVTFATVGAIAATGVDAVSVGALTHSAPAVDLSLEIETAGAAPEAG